MKYGTVLTFISVLLEMCAFVAAALVFTLCANTLFSTGYEYTHAMLVACAIWVIFTYFRAHCNRR